DIVNSDDHAFRTNHPSQDRLVLYKVLPKYVGTEGAVIGWMSNLPASSQVEYGLTDAYGLIVSDDAFVTSHAVEIPGLAENTTYHYRVISETEYGLVVESDDATFTTWLSPLVISDLQIAPGILSLTVTWTTNRPADSRVEYSEDDSYGEVTPPMPELVTEHSVTIEDLLPDVLYHVRAWSIDDWGYAASSGDHSGTTLPPALAVYNLVAADIAMTTACIEFQTTNPARCRIEYGLGDSLALSTPEEPDHITYHGIDLAGLAPGASYVYRVVATDCYGQVEVTETTTFETRPLEVPDPPSITELTVRGISASSARVSWTTNRPATSEVQYGPAVNYSSGVYDPSLTTEHNIVLTGLEFESIYHFRVISEDAEGLRAVTSDDTFSIINSNDGTPPETPVVPEIVGTSGGLSISLPSQPAESAIVAHRIYRRAENELFCEMIAEVGASENAYVDTGLADGVTYEYTISAIDLWGVESNRSAPVSGVAGTGAGACLWIFPNPVRGSAATMRVSPPSAVLEARGEPWSYKIRIYDAGGRLVRTISARNVASAVENVTWDTRNDRGKGVATGVYFCELSAAGARARTKLIVIR
ncbi:hypothetical protein K8S17_05305, partial [bacterium]|nr:hypothetical protein [bacterium]